MSVLRAKAIVLRRTNYGEADRIVQFLTDQQGKVSAIARGARREKSKLAGGIELFSRSDVTVSAGKGDLGILTSARPEKFYRSILADYDRLQFAYEALKQITRASENVDEPAFFDLLDQTLAALDDQDIFLDVVRAWFWLQLGILIGGALNLATDENGAKLEAGKRYNFDTDAGAFTASENGRFSSDRIKLLRLLSAQPPRVVMQVEGMTDLLEDCLWLAERAVGH